MMHHLIFHLYVQLRQCQQTDDLIKDYQDIPELDPQNMPQGTMISSSFQRRILKNNILIMFKQQKFHSLIVKKQFSSSMYLTFPFCEAREQEDIEVEEEEGNLDSIHVTEITLMIITTYWSISEMAEVENWKR